MVTSRQMHKLATSPSAHLKFMTTGELPRGTRPQGPLVDLLSTISPRDRAAIRGLTVDLALGYQGSRVFGSAEQAFRWVHPDREVFGSFPADSWRMKGRSLRLHIEDVIENATAAPDRLADRYPQLRRPVPIVNKVSAPRDLDANMDSANEESPKTRSSKGLRP